MILTEIDWLPKASLIALEAAAESRSGSVSDSAITLAACFILDRLKFRPKVHSFFVLCSSSLSPQTSFPVCDLYIALLRFIYRTFAIYISHNCDLDMAQLRFTNRTFVIYISHLRFTNRTFVIYICHLLFRNRTLCCDLYIAQ